MIGFESEQPYRRAYRHFSRHLDRMTLVLPKTKLTHVAAVGRFPETDDFLYLSGRLYGGHYVFSLMMTSQAPSIWESLDWVLASQLAEDPLKQYAELAKAKMQTNILYLCASNEINEARLACVNMMAHHFAERVELLLPMFQWETCDYLFHQLAYFDVEKSFDREKELELVNSKVLQDFKTEASVLHRSLIQSLQWQKQHLRRYAGLAGKIPGFRYGNYIVGMSKEPMTAVMSVLSDFPEFQTVRDTNNRRLGVNHLQYQPRHSHRSGLTLLDPALDYGEIEQVEVFWVRMIPDCSTRTTLHYAFVCPYDTTYSSTRRLAGALMHVMISLEYWYGTYDWVEDRLFSSFDVGFIRKCLNVAYTPAPKFKHPMVRLFRNVWMQKEFNYCPKPYDPIHFTSDRVLELYSEFTPDGFRIRALEHPHALSEPVSLTYDSPSDESEGEMHPEPMLLDV